METREIKVGDEVTLIGRPAFGRVIKILPLEKEAWGFRSQKYLVRWEAYSGWPEPNEYQSIKDIKLIDLTTQS